MLAWMSILKIRFHREITFFKFLSGNVLKKIHIVYTGNTWLVELTLWNYRPLTKSYILTQVDIRYNYYNFKTELNVWTLTSLPQLVCVCVRIRASTKYYILRSRFTGSKPVLQLLHHSTYGIGDKADKAIYFLSDVNWKLAKISKVWETYILPSAAQAVMISYILCVDMVHCGSIAPHQLKVWKKYTTSLRVRWNRNLE